jgi:gamma-glutamyl phosphate reductase|tara:strand:+ start:307 stop:723 length:417 start_codon:yes stop_codon:yes gene_type:complete
MSDINSAIIERLEKVVDTLQENSVKMGQLLAVHNEKLDKQDKIDEVLFEKIDRLSADVNRETSAIKKGCERDIRKVDDRLRLMEKKMWSIAGGLTIISFLVSPVGQKILQGLTASNETSMIPTVERVDWTTSKTNTFD